MQINNNIRDALTHAKGFFACVELEYREGGKEYATEGNVYAIKEDTLILFNDSRKTIVNFKDIIVLKINLGDI